MPHYVTLMNWTEQGLHDARSALKRLEQARRKFAHQNARIVDVYYTLGAYDVVCVIEAPDDETAYRLMLNTAMEGNVKTQTFRAFSEHEMESLVVPVQRAEAALHH